MAYPAYENDLNDYNGGTCPPTHPTAVFSLFFEFIWYTKGFSITSTGTTQKWIYSMNDTTGYALHGDFLNGWTNQTLLQSTMSSCNRQNNNGFSRCTLDSYPNAPGNLFNKTDTPVPSEEVGVNGPLKKLPGF